eukprot:gene16487-biopygen13588
MALILPVAQGAGEVTGTDRLGEDAARAYLDAVEKQRSALRRRPQAFWPDYIISEPDFDTHPRCKSSKAV